MAMDMTTALTIQAKVVGQNQIGGLTKGLGGLTTQTNKAQGAMNRLKIAAGGALTSLRNVLPVIGVAAVAGFAKKNLEAADQMSKLSKRTGIAVPMLDKFRQAAELSDTSIQSLERAFPNLARGIDDAVVKGTGPAADAFNRLGIGLTDAEGKVRDTDQVMLDLADRFRQMPDGTEKAALASQIFGQRLGSELIPMLNEGGDSIRNMSTALTQDFADKSAEFNDKLTTMGEKLGQLGMKITEALLPFLEKLVDGVAFLAQKFAALPGPVQAAIGAIAGIAAVGLVFAPIIGAVTTLAPLLIGLSPIILKVIAVGAGLAALGVAFQAIVDTVMGVARAINEGFIIPITEGIGALGQLIGEAFQPAFEAVKQAFVTTFEFIGANFVKPVSKAISSVVGFIGKSFASLYEAITRPIRQAFEVVTGIVNKIMGAVRKALRAIAKLAGRRKAAAANTQQAAEGAYWRGGFKAFANGGVVNGPTLGLIGEGGESEYIVPSSKAVGFARNILSGVRGSGAIPRFAEGGFVAPTNASVNIQTGPVTQMGGQDFVTKSDMSRAVQSGVQQTLDLIQRDGNVRARLGF